MTDKLCGDALGQELSDLMRDLEDRKGHSAWLIQHWPTVLRALRRPPPSSEAVASKLRELCDRLDWFGPSRDVNIRITVAEARALLASPAADQQGAEMTTAANKGWSDEFRRGMEHAANLYEQVNPASDLERHHSDPGAGAMGAVIEFRDLIRKEART
jgi:hypothetical protein